MSDSSSLAAGRLIDAAVAETGLNDFGDDEFTDRVTRFCDAVWTEGRLSEIGVVMTELEVVRLLSNRLRFHRDLREHPEILDEEIVPPIVIVGLPRTGTSKLQRIMSADPGVQGLFFWRLLNPAPLPGSQPGEPDPRIGVAEEASAALAAAFPDFMAGHPTRADLPDEDLILYQFTFDAYVTPFFYRHPTFRNWLLGRPAEPSYAYVKSMLQYLQWQDGGGRSRPWILKTPVHIGHLPVLLDNYPGATVVHCHRDPRVVMASFCRLIEVSQRMRSDDVDLVEVRDEQLEYWGRQVERGVRDRENGFEEHVLDVRYEDIVEDSGTVIRQIYDRANRPVTPEAEAAFAEWETTNFQDRHGRHVYSMDRFDLTPELIEQYFPTYLARFYPDKGT